MQRVTISLPPELIARLKVLAAERGTSMAALIREAVEQKTTGVWLGPGKRPKPKSLGSFSSGRDDLSELVSSDDYHPGPYR